jgi:GMP synthase-like glutamine amidotransferase
MRIVVLQHADYEGPGAIASWATDRGHAMTTVIPLFESYPSADDFEMLVVMGGPMGARDDATYPWLTSEKLFIAEAIAAGRRVFGICLGSQLLAEALGGRAHPNPVREVGWFPVRLTPTGRYSRALAVLPDEFVAGQWHGDTLDLPEGVKTAASSDVCENQAFECCDSRVVGVQFHLEWTPDALVELVERHGDWLSAETGADPSVVTASEFLKPLPELARGHELLYALLDRMEDIA